MNLSHGSLKLEKLLPQFCCNTYLWEMVFIILEKNIFLLISFRCEWPEVVWLPLSCLQMTSYPQVSSRENQHWIWNVGKRSETKISSQHKTIYSNWQEYLIRRCHNDSERWKVSLFKSSDIVFVKWHWSSSFQH